MADEQQSAEYQELANAIKSATEQASSSSKNSSDNVKKVARALADLGKVGKLAFNGVLDANGGFSAMNNSVTSAGNMLRRLSGTGSAATASFSMVVTGVENSVKSLNKFNDAMIKFHDGMGDYGVSVGHSTDEMLKLAHSAGYSLEKSGQFSKLLASTNTSLISLAPTASEGADKLALIFDNTAMNETQQRFLRLGIGPEQLNKMQVNYIKLQGGYGAKLSGSADQIREASVQYALTVNRLSVLTGERREDIEQTMNAANLDIKFSLKKRMLEESGNKQAIAAFEKTDVLLSLKLGKQEAAAFRDFAANQTATTEEGRALMVKTQGKIIGWVRSVEAGTMTPVEIAKLIAKSEADYIAANSEQLKTSEEFQKQMQITGQTIKGAADIAAMKTEEDADRMLAEQQAQNDDRKKLQNDQLNIERFASRSLDKVKLSVAGPATTAFTWLLTQIRQLASGVINLALILPVGDDVKKTLAEFQKILGGDSTLKKQMDTMDSDVRGLTAQTKLHSKISDELIVAEKEKAEAEKQNKLLTERISGGEKIDPIVLRQNELDLNKKRSEVAAIKKREADLLKGRTAVQLEAERKAAVSRRAAAEQKASAGAATQERAGAPSKGKGIGGLLELIGRKEGRGNYNIIQGSEVVPGLTNKTLDEVYQLQTQMIRNKDEYASSAVGKYQFVRKTLFGVAAQLGLDTKTTKFDEATQDRLAERLIRDSGYDAYEAGRISKESLMTKLSKVWAALPMDASGKGYYDGKNTNKSLVGWEEALASFRTGGISSGPKSGYEVTLHGNEAIIPLLPDNTVPLELKNKDRTTDFSNITNSIKAKIAVMAEKLNSAVSSNAPDEMLVNIVLDKVNSMISQVEMSNSVQSELKMYLRN